MSKRIGFYLYGRLSDKITPEMKNTPEGHSWVFGPLFDIFLKQGWEVYYFYPMETTEVQNYKLSAFAAFECDKRWKVYNAIEKISDPLKDPLPPLDVLIMYYRWDRGEFYKQIYGDIDLRIQEKLISHYSKSSNTAIFFLNPDCKIPTNFSDSRITGVLNPSILPDEFFQSINFKFYSYYPPYALWPDSEILPSTEKNPLKDIVYVGNRYERDAEFEKWYVNYSKLNPYKVHVYGNWFRTFEEIFTIKKWWFVCYHARIGFQEFYDAYKDAVSCVLITKPEYYRWGFITQRPFESVYFGTLPLLPIQEPFPSYESLIPKKYHLHDFSDLLDKIYELKKLSLEEYDFQRKKLWDYFKSLCSPIKFYNKIQQLTENNNSLIEDNKNVD